MGMGTGGSGKGPSSEINVTPLVDVCLVLLIIFMVMIPKNVPEISVQVPPENKTKKPPPDKSDTLVIGLTKDGAITLNSNPVNTKDELADLISSRLQGREKKVVFIDFDDDLCPKSQQPATRFISLLDAAHTVNEACRRKIRSRDLLH